MMKWGQPEKGRSWPSTQTELLAGIRLNDPQAHD